MSSGYPDDRFDDRRPDPRTAEQVRSAVRVPAVFLILNGLLGLVICAVLSVPLVFDPDMIVRFVKDVAAQQPAGQQKQDLENRAEELEKQLNQNRDAFVNNNAIKLGIGAALNLLAVVGGFYMASLRGYGMSMAGAIVSVIPFATGCCLTGLPFGIWALVVLMRPEVKAAFAASRAGPPPNPDEQYMR